MPRIKTDMTEVKFDEKGNPYTEIEENPRSNKYQRIIDLVEDPNTPVTHINRLIAVEIAATIKDISDSSKNPLANLAVKSKESQVKALRELSKTLQETDVLSRKDILNFDGPKFQYVMAEFISMLKKSIVAAGYSEESANEILRIFKDTMSTREADLRREVDKIENNKS